MFLSSGGGNVGEAFAAGVAIEEAGASVIVSENDLCASACFLLFLAGDQKVVYPGARIGVHSNSTPKGDEDEGSLASTAWLARLYEKLGVPPNVIAKSVTTPPDEIYWLTDDDLRAMKVVVVGPSPQPPPQSQPPQAVASLPPDTLPRQRFSVEGLAVGEPVVPKSAAYKAYSCRKSKQYARSIWCHRVKIEDGAQVSLTIIHSKDLTTSYVNKEVSPAFFTGRDIDTEVARLSQLYGSSPHIYNSPQSPGFPTTIIAVWGNVELRPLTDRELALLARGKNPHRGVLVDFLGSFTVSAQLGWPVYALSGGKGFVWIANFDDKGRGSLRFFAADPSRMTAPKSTKLGARF